MFSCLVSRAVVHCYALPLIMPHCARSLLRAKVPSEAVGAKVATALLTRRLAACVNIIPGVTSMYHWDGAIQCDKEHLLVVKTRSAHVDAISALVKDKDVHPYDCVEVVALPIAAGAPDYLHWVTENTAGP